MMIETVHFRRARAGLEELTNTELLALRSEIDKLVIENGGKDRRERLCMQLAAHVERITFGNHQGRIRIYTSIKKKYGHGFRECTESELEEILTGFHVAPEPVATVAHAGASQDKGNGCIEEKYIPGKREGTEQPATEPEDS